jgi:beta-N-acetylhexosaminidase
MAAIAAGCDMILHCNGKMPEMHEVAAATPVLAGEALRRATAALAAKRPAKLIDIAASRNEFAGLMSGIWQAAEGTA